jgi:hypothetical protein
MSTSLRDQRVYRTAALPATVSNPILRPWYKLTAPAPVGPQASLAAREANRRGRIASLIIAGLLIALLLAVADVPFSRANLASLLVALAGCIVAIPLNRTGRLTAAGWSLTLAVDGALAIPLLTTWGMLDPIYLPVYYLMIVPALIAVTLLPPITVFVVGLANSLFIAYDILYEPHNMMWDQMVTSGGELFSLLIGPVALHIVVTLLSYLWVRSADTALRRADRAEEVARLEHRGAEQRRLLAEGIQQILQAHVRFANGDFSTRAPANQDNILWQVSVALNNLFARYQRLAQEDGFSRETTEQVTQTRIALRQWQAGREPAWPRPSGGPFDPLIADLRIIFQGLPTPGVSGTPYGRSSTSTPAWWSSSSAGSSRETGGMAQFGAPSGPSQPVRSPFAPEANRGAGPSPDRRQTAAPEGRERDQGAPPWRPDGA